MVKAAGVRHGGRGQVADLRMRHDDGVHSAHDKLFANVQGRFDRIGIHFDGVSVKRVAGFHERRVEVEMLHLHTNNIYHKRRYIGKNAYDVYEEKN